RHTGVRRQPDPDPAPERLCSRARRVTGHPRGRGPGNALRDELADRSVRAPRPDRDRRPRARLRGALAGASRAADGAAAAAAGDGARGAPRPEVRARLLHLRIAVRPCSYSAVHGDVPSLPPEHADRRALPALGPAAGSRRATRLPALRGGGRTVGLGAPRPAGPARDRLARLARPQGRLVNAAGSVDPLTTRRRRRFG